MQYNLNSFQLIKVSREKAFFPLELNLTEYETSKSLSPLCFMIALFFFQVIWLHILFHRFDNLMTFSFPFNF